MNDDKIVVFPVELPEQFRIALQHHLLTQLMPRARQIHAFVSNPDTYKIVEVLLDLQDEAHAGMCLLWGTLSEGRRTRSLPKSYRDGSDTGNCGRRTGCSRARRSEEGSASAGR
jgi:hypothetical protein